MSKLLSVLIPVYNEQSYIHRLLDNVRLAQLPPNWQREIIVIDDGSTDETLLEIKRFIKSIPSSTQIKLMKNSYNKGKGAAVKTGMREAKGDLLIIQDGDLEYDPADFSIIIEKFAQPQVKVVYGSRVLGRKIYHSFNANTLFLWGGLSLTKIVNWLFKTNITDQPTCYKAWRQELTPNLIDYCQQSGFDFEVEMTACFSQLTKIDEVPIHYYPRSASHGKKITLLDFFKSVKVAIICYKRMHN